LKPRKRNRKLIEPPLELYNQLDGALIGKIVNISDMGIRMESDQAAPDNTFMRMAVKLPEKINDSEGLFFDAITLWCKQNPDSKTYAIGCQVLNIKPEELQKLADLMENYLQNEK
jgi:hypothetical protein